MSIRLNATIELSDEDVARLLAHRPEPGSPEPEVRQVRPAVVTDPEAIELPEPWELIEEQQGVTYSWPEGPDVYDPFRIYEADTAAGRVRLAIGECERVNVRGKDRKYLITHYIGAGGGKRPVTEFLEVDDYEETRDLIAIIKGKGGGAKLYDPTDDLPGVYDDRFRIEVYRDRIDYPRSYNKLGVVAREDDAESMLNHTLIQVLSRGLDQD